MKVQYAWPGSSDYLEEDAAEPVHVLVRNDLVVTITSEGIVVDWTDEDGNEVLETWHRPFSDLIGAQTTEDDDGHPEGDPRGGKDGAGEDR